MGHTHDSLIKHNNKFSFRINQLALLTFVLKVIGIEIKKWNSATPLAGTLLNDTLYLEASTKLETEIDLYAVKYT